MSTSQMLLPEFDQEMANTRRALERVRNDRLDWQPHPRSMTLKRLASHLAELPGWGMNILAEDTYDLATFTPSALASVAEIVRLFDQNQAVCRRHLAALSDADLMTPWSLQKGGQTLFTQPRIAVFRGMLLNHIVHHRGQLTVYLRLTDTPVPSIYGPSADESGM